MSAGQTYLSKFSRITSGGRFIPQLDGLRFIAIAMVVLVHMHEMLLEAQIGYGREATSGAVYRVVEHGWHGVQFFFVISGFILALPFAAHYLLGRDRVDLNRYYLRRLTRLEPPYLVAMIGFFFILIWWRGMTATELFPNLLASLFYLHGPIYAELSPLNQVAWSLEIEVQFYLLAPLLGALFFRIPGRWLRRGALLAASAAMIFIQQRWIPYQSVLSFTLAGYLQFFLVGFLLADVYLLDWREAPTRHWRWDVVSLAGWPLLFLLWEVQVVYELRRLGDAWQARLADWIFPFLAVLLCMAVFRGPVGSRIMSIPWITTIGGMCYAIYLLHLNLMIAVTSVTAPLMRGDWFALDLLIQLAIFIPILLVVSGLFFVLIERPCMKPDWPRRLMEWGRGRRRKPVQTVPPVQSSATR